MKDDRAHSRRSGAGSNRMLVSSIMSSGGHRPLLNSRSTTHLFISALIKFNFLWNLCIHLSPPAHLIGCAGSLRLVEGQSVDAADLELLDGFRVNHGHRKFALGRSHKVVALATAGGIASTSVLKAA